MEWKQWDELPEIMKNEEVKKYFQILEKKKGQLILKRLFDITLSFLLCVILSPVFLIIGMWIKADSKGSVFYRQERITQYGKVFKIYKFRTMVTDADKIGSLVTAKGDARVTRVGEKIRKCRIDEIPQLINILKGEMSFVGTRPEVKKYVNAYTEEMYATLLLPAGVTSLASIKFKDEDRILQSYMKKDLTVDEIYETYIIPKKMKLNLQYLIEFNILCDIRVSMKTLGGLLG